MRNFEIAKSQVDRDLTNFMTDVGMQQSSAQPPSPAMVDKLLALCNKCLSENVASFWTTIKDLVDELEELRKQSAPGPDKLLITKLLFILARCSRLVLLQDASPYTAAERERSLYSTMPRPTRHVFHTAVKPTRGGGKDGIMAGGGIGSMSVNIRRTATVPSRTPDVASAMGHLKLSDIPGSGMLGCGD